MVSLANSWADYSHPNIPDAQNMSGFVLINGSPFMTERKRQSETILNTQIQVAVDPRRQGSLCEPGHFEAAFRSVKPLFWMAVIRIRICSLPYFYCKYIVFNIDHALQEHILSSNIIDVMFCRWLVAPRVLEPLRTSTCKQQRRDM